MLVPEMTYVKQRLKRAPVGDVTRSVADALDRLKLDPVIRKGQTVAVAVGSRGIRRIDTVVSACLRFLMEKGLRPFIVPAMGSHGGATAEGQRTVLETLGVSEAAMGCAVEADMEVSTIGRLDWGLTLYLSTKALAADHIVVVNRVKPHTKFRAAVESGLCKMLTVGLGKHRGAEEYHRWAVRRSFAIIEEAAAAVLQNCPVLFGLALVEDGCGDLSRVSAVTPSAIIDTDKALLKEASALMARIPFDALDILVVDRIGKDISGIGMDSNVTGRHRDLAGDFISSPRVKRIFVRDLSPASDGNANGIGLADVTTRRLVEAIDRRKTYQNAITAISPEKAAVPIYFDTDREALDVCARTSGLESLSQTRLVRIADTKNLEVLQVSRTLAAEITADAGLEQLTPWRPMSFDEAGNLLPFGEGREEGNA
jgi:hypothetical protein